MLHDRKFQKTVLMIAVPLMLQQLIVSSVNLIDNLMVGQLGDMALSGVSMANRFYMIVWAGVNGMIASSVIYLSQYNGANDTNHMKQSFRFMIVSSYILCIALFIIAFFFPEMVIAFFIKDVEVIRLGSAYLKIAAISYLPSVISLCIASAFRALGETKKPLYISVISVLTNAVFNYLLIFGVFGFPKLGVVGAAIATLIARSVEALIYLWMLKVSDMPFKTKVSNIFTFDFELAKRITIRAFPLCVNEIMWSFGMSTLVRSYSHRGLVVNTAYSMSSTISDLFFVLFGGMATASTVLIGTPLGANKLEEAKENAYKLLGFSLILAGVILILMFATSYVAPYFYNVSMEAKHLSANFLRIMALFFVLYMFNTSIYFILRAGGDTKSTLFMDSGFMWMLNIPLVMLLAYHTNLHVLIVYAIGQSTDVLKACVSYYLLKKEKWVKNLTT